MTDQLPTNYGGDETSTGDEMQYMGGKARIAKDLAAVMLAIAPQRETYLEPFLGGCHVLPLMSPHFALSIASDVMPDVAMLWRDALAGWRPPTEVTREQYAALRHAEPSALRGFVGFGCSFGGKWFGGYADDRGAQPSRAGGYAAPSARAVAKQISTIDATRTVIREQDYREHAPAAGTVVYCDPPYAGTTTYKDAPPWDVELFWKTMREWVDAGAIVFVSEYVAPDDWRSVWALPAGDPLKSKAETGFGSHKQRGLERLFMHVSQAVILTSTPTMTGERMSTSEETRLALKRKDDARRAAVDAAVDAALQAGGDYYHHDDAARAIHAAAQVIAESWRAEAISYEGSTKRDQSAKVRQRLRDSAAELLGFTAGLISPAFIESLSSVETDAQLPAHDANQPVDLMGALRASIPETVAKLADAMEGKTQTVEGQSEPTSWTEPEGWTPQEIAADHASVARHVDEQIETALGDAAAIQSYLKGETDVIPQNAPGTAPVSLPSIVFVDPAPLAPPRMSWDEFAAAIADMPSPDHGSFSMVTSLADCGMAYALDRLAKLTQAGGYIVKPPMPAWYLVGGSAFHSAVETIERTVMTEGNLASDFDAGALWRKAFQAEIIKTSVESGFTDSALWRAADKGRENYDWWRVQGEDMVRRYVHYHNPEWRRTHQILVMPDGRPALELELTLDLAGWPFKCVIDQVWFNMETSTLYIDDLKSGKSKQPSTFQLGGYAHALASALTSGPGPTMDSGIAIAGGFYDARAGSHDMEVDDLLTAHPMTELRHRAYAAANMVKAKAYLPRVSNFGGGCTSCGHRAICPAQS